MEYTKEELISSILYNMQKQTLLNKASFIFNNHLNNLNSFLVSCAELNEMNSIFNSFCRKSNSQNDDYQKNQIKETKDFGEELLEENKEDKENKETLNDFVEKEKNEKFLSRSLCQSETAQSTNTKPLKFFIEKDKLDSDKFLEKKNFFIKDIKVKENGKEKSERKYICNENNCAKEYKSKENLILHIRNKHFGQKPYFCRYCGKKYSHRSGKNFFLFF